MKKSLFILALFLIVNACKTNTYLPKPNEMNYFTRGLWIECNLKNKTTINGEILALNKNQAFILPLFGEVLTIEKQNIKNAVIHVSLTANQPEELRAAPLIPLLSLTHGWWAFFTLPINISVVAPTVSSQRSGTYIIDYPKAVKWEQLAKFSRFPQGIPEGLDIYSLK